MCNGSGEIFISEGPDQSKKSAGLGLPERWVYRRCSSCRTLWLDPRPKASIIPRLYAGDYATHTTPTSALDNEGNLLSQVRHAIKLGIIESRFGYNELHKRSRHPLLSKLCRPLSAIPVLANWAGYTVRWLKQKSDGKMLEIGCGNGSFLMTMKELDWSAEGIEPDSECAAIAHRFNLSVIDKPFEEVHFDNEVFDAITLHHVIEHVSDPVAFLSKLAPSLKSGGKLVLIYPNPETLLLNVFKENWHNLSAPYHLVLPTIPVLSKRLESLGLKAQCWTTHRLASFASVASMQQAHALSSNELPLTLKIQCQMLSLLARLIIIFAPRTGEEIVCIATKSPSRLGHNQAPL